MAVPAPNSSPWTQQPSVPAGNVSTVPEQGAEMEVSLLAPCSAKATSHCPQHVAFWRQKEQKVLFSGTPLCPAHPPPLPCGDVRHPQRGKPPRPGGAGVSHAGQQSGRGDLCPATSWERRRGSRGPGGTRGTDHSPGLCVGLCRSGLCVAVTQIVMGVSWPGGAVQRVVLII